MGKISGFFAKQKNFIKDIYKIYGVTIVSSIILSVIFVISNHIDRNDIYDHIIFVLLLFLTWSFFFESFFYKKNQTIIKKTILLGIGVLASVSLDIIVYNIQNNIAETYIYYFISFYIIFLIGCALFIIIRKQNVQFHEYIARVIFGLLRAVGLFIILHLAIFLLLELFDNLIVNVDYWDVLSDIEIIIAGLIYLPVCLVTLVKAEEENSKFTKGVITYALMPCVIIAILIIYIYIIKIFVTWQIPSNEIFYICAWLFALAAPVWTMAYAFTKDKNNIYAKIIKYMKYIYAPFILLEIYSIAIRISEYGVTESRYAAVIFIIFQMIYEMWEIILILIKKMRKKEKTSVYGKHYEYMILVLIALAFISLLIPGINATYVSYLSQKNIFESNKDSDIGTAFEAYYYIETNPYGENWLDKNFTKEELSELQEKYYDKIYNTEDKNKLKWEYVGIDNREFLSYGFDISGYRKIYSSSCGYYNREYTNEECKTIEMRIGKDNCVNIDITDCLSYYADIDEDPEQYSDEQKIYRIDIDENHVFVISEINFCYIGDISRIKNLSISGYVLEK